MMGKTGFVLLAAFGLAAVLTTGCVERYMVIRSEPAGAPVWVDEVRIGQTPLTHPFHHYGTRRVRVGPVRDEGGAIAYGEAERLVEISPPWYEKFPLDFFSEVLYPWTLLDEHTVEFELLPPSEQGEHYGEERAREVLKQAEELRQEGLSPVPEEED